MAATPGDSHGAAALQHERGAQTPPDPDMTPVQKFGEAIADRVERWMPSPFIFAVLLTYAAAIAAFISEGSSPVAIAQAWYGGFWSLLTFAMQMVLILVLANVVAYHPRVRGVIDRLVKIPKNGRQAVLVVAIGSMITGWISWGLGLIFGAILAREMGKQCERGGMAAHYPLLAVAGYMGMSLTWGWGLSQSAGLLQATPGNIFMQQGIIDRIIPATEWVFHPYPATLTILSMAFASLMLYLLCPPDDHCRSISRYVELTEDEKAGTPSTPLVPTSTKAGSLADKFDNSKLLGASIASIGVVLFLITFATSGLGALNLNVLNFGFLMIGLLLFTNPSLYEREFNRAVSGSAGVILLFPFYAGIVGIMSGTGLVNTVADSLLSIATPSNFPVIAWITAGIMNVFVPSAGGEWGILGAPMLIAAQELDVPMGQMLSAYAAGDAHTNLLNPFWALPLLAITGLRARDMFGYAITMMLILYPFLAVLFYFLPY